MKYISFFRVVILCLICNLNVTNSTANTPYFERISWEEGLEQNSIFAIEQDMVGFLWLGTRKGLIRYDGLHFKSFQFSNIDGYSEPIGKVSSLKLLPDGKLLALSSTGIHSYDPELCEISKQMQWNYSLGGDADIIVLPDSVVIIASDKGLYRYLSPNLFAKIEFAKNTFFEKNEVGRNILHIDGDLYLVGTNNGIATCVFLPNENTLKVVSYTSSLGSPINVCRESSSIFWFATVREIKRINVSFQGSIEEMDYSTYKGYHTSQDVRFTDILMASDGNIYATSIWDGVFQINTFDKTVEQYIHNEHSNSISWDNVFCILEDCFNVLWFGTGQGGLTKYDTKRKVFNSIYHQNLIDNTLPHNHVSQIFTDSRGFLWVGTFQSGINISTKPIDKHNFSDVKFEAVDFKEDDAKKRGFSFLELDRYIILSRSNILCFYDKNTDEIKELNDNSKLSNLLSSTRQIITIERDYKGRLWVGGDHFVICIDYKNDVKKLINGECEILPFSSKELAVSLNKKKCNKIVSTSDNVFIATESGLFVAKDKNGVLGLQHYEHIPNDSTSISSNTITTAFIDSKANIWLGTFNQGLNRIVLDSNNNVFGFDNLFNTINLPSITVFGIQEDEENNLWLSSFSGLYKYSVSDNKYKTYTTSEGLKSNLFHIYSSDKTRDGLMIFGGIAGLTGFVPHDIISNKIAPKVSITGLKIFNKPVEIGEEYLGEILLSSSISHQKKIKIPYALNTITLEFSAFHFSAPQKNKFSYMLEGVDKDWITTSVEHNFANYTNLSSGNYTFKITALNSDGVKNENLKLLEIVILPPWYATWWAISVFVCLTLSLLFLVYSYFHKMTMLSHSLELETLEREKSRDLFDAKQRFFMNISHELKTPLTLIFTPLEKLMSRENNSPEDKKTMSVMQKNANRLLHLIDQIMDFRRLEKDKINLSVQEYDLNLLIDDTISSFNQEIEKKQIELIFDNKNDLLLIWFDVDRIEKVIYNLISNAIKHTSSKNKIHISTRIENERIIIRVENEGAGIPAASKQQIFDRFVQLGEQSSGTGIGLSICKSFVELHHGDIKEIGIEGESAIFEASIPVNANELFPHSEKEKVTHQVSKEKFELDEEHRSSILDGFNNKDSILIVEDNVDMLEMVSAALSDKFEIYSAADGIQGLELALKYIPSLIISDVMMPEMDGNQMCREIKENSITNHIPVIMLTAKGSLDHKIEGLDSGADAYITKPFEIGFLEAQITNLLASRKKIHQSFKEKYGLGLSNLEITPVDEQFLKKFILFIEENISEPDLKVADAADEMSYSYMQFNRKIKAITGEPVGHFISNFRLNRAKQIIQADPERNIAEVMYSVGFNNSSYFSKCFKKEFGLTPKEYKEQHRK